MLGEAAWGAIEHKEFDCWDEFQALVDDRWGLSPEQRRGAFYSLRPRPGESFEKFVERVEDKRCKLQIDDEPVLRAFWPLVPTAVKTKLDMIHAVQCTIQGKAYTRVTWDRVVEVCRSSHHSFAALAGVPEDPASAAVAPGQIATADVVSHVPPIA